MTCWLWNLLTGAVEISHAAWCLASLALPPVPDTFLSDPMWREPLPLDRYIA